MGLSLREMSEKLNVSHQTIKKYEENTLTPNSERLIQISKLFNINLSDDYIEFLNKIDMFEFSWLNININGVEFELNHFLGYDEESSRIVQRITYKFLKEFYEA